MNDGAFCQLPHSPSPTLAGGTSTVGRMIHGLHRQDWYQSQYRASATMVFVD